MLANEVMLSSYDQLQVALSVLIAVSASYAALDLAGRVTAARGLTRSAWLTGGAVSMGIGIWAMHYIGMLAFRLPVPVSYHWPTVLLSLLAGISCSAFALMAKLDEATRSTGQFNQRFRIICTHGEVRWVHVRGFPVRNPDGQIFRLVGTAQEITEQKHAEDQVAENLAIAEAARAEADALRKATLALTQDLRMDFVMEALLRSLEELIPYTCARVLVPEGGPHVLALGERQVPEPPKTSPKYRPGHPLTLIAEESPFLKRLIEERKSILISDTKEEKEWQSFKGHADLRSWLSVPLMASDEYLGLLSVGHRDPNLYTQDHLRRAELLSIPAAAAIQNARLFAKADIYASELEKRLVDLREAENALAQAKGSRQVSEDKFHKVFRCSPIPFSITTVKEGRFVEINTAFERRYGYSREELLGRTVHELGMWCDPADRISLVEQLHRGSPVRNVITWLRTKSGEVKLTAYSADRIHFDGEPTLLVKELFVARMKTQNLSPGDRSTRTEQAPRESRSKFSIRVQELELFRGLAG